MKSEKENTGNEVSPEKERPLISFDWVVKRLLRNKANFEVVEGFLSELLGREVRITNVLESESNQTEKKDKQNRVDIVVESTDGEIILIELQFIMETDYFLRMLYGVSKAITERMFQGDAYKKVKKIYSINIVYFDLGHGKGYVYRGKTDFRNIYDKEDILHLPASQQKIFGCIEAGEIYPEYYVLKISEFKEEEEIITTLDEWIYFLKTDKIKEHFKAKGLQKAREVLAYDRLSREEKAIYAREQDAKNAIIDQIFSAKLEGISQGIDEGREEGIKKGREEGIKKGREEAEKKYASIIEEQAQEIEDLKRLIASRL